MNNDELFFPKERHLGKIIITIFLILIVFGGILIYYNFSYANPLTIADKSFNELINLFNEKLKNINTDNPLELNGLIKINNNNPETNIAKIFNDMDIQLNIKTDEPKKIYFFNLESKYRNNKLLSIKSYTENNTIYYKSNEIYDNYVNIRDNYSFVTKQNITNIFEKIINTIKNETIKNDWQRSDEDKYFNNFLKLDNQIAKEFLLKVLNNFQNDKDFINQLTILNPNIKQILSNYINNINSQENNHYQLSFYTEKSFSQKLFKIEQKVNDTVITIELIDNNNYLITFKNVNDSKIIKLTLSDKVININIEKKESIIDIKFNYNNISSFNENISNAKKKDDLTLNELEKINNKIHEKEEIELIYNELKKILNIKDN